MADREPVRYLVVDDNAPCAVHDGCETLEEAIRTRRENNARDMERLGYQGSWVIYRRVDETEDRKQAERALATRASDLTVDEFLSLRVSLRKEVDRG